MKCEHILQKPEAYMIIKKMNQTQLSGNKLIPELFLPGITFDKYPNKMFSCVVR